MATYGSFDEAAKAARRAENRIAELRTDKAALINMRDAADKSKSVARQQRDKVEDDLKWVKAKVVELRALLANGGRCCGTCKFQTVVEPCGVGCIHDKGRAECFEDDEDPYRHWICAVDRGQV